MSSYPEESGGRRPYGDPPLSPVALEARRQLALDRLTEAFSRDAISMEAYETKVGAIQGARLPQEIEAAVANLPVLPPLPKNPGPAGRKGREASPSLANPIDPRLRGEESVACIMGTRVLQGDFLSGDKIGVFTLMGTTRIDLTTTALPPGRLKIDTFCVMGDVKVIVPRGLPVKMSALPIMGNSHIDREVGRRISRGEPYLEINGLALMGNLVVVTSKD